MFVFVERSGSDVRRRIIRGDHLPGMRQHDVERQMRKSGLQVSLAPGRRGGRGRMTLRENAAVLETYLHNIRNIEEMPPGPVELDALDAAVETMKAAVENVEYGAFAWDKQRGMFVQIGRSVPVKQLCLNRYQERVRNGEMPSWIDPEKFKILERTVAEIASDWN
jgi:hypothetical protein